jgi:NAD(P)-dependent dehydrogenase (short-subunit alcohol dehydrogenase family)
MKNAIIISASSGIGEALANSWIEKGWNLFGTYRTKSPAVDQMQNLGMSLFSCDLSSTSSIELTCEQLIQACPEWDVLVFAVGSLEPIGPFEKVAFDKWAEAVHVNFIQQLRILHMLLPSRSRTSSPSVLFFAGGGTNNAVTNYSSYTISKIALTKMCEFLDAEMPDVRYSIVGPGWVNTKIHEATLKAGAMAGENLERTEKKTDWVPMEQVVKCCTWIVTTASHGVKGRNFSVAHDLFGDPALEKALENNPDMYKLRRSHNSWSKM